MKKIILCCLLISGSLTFAQTGTPIATTQARTPQEQTIAPKTDTTLESVARNIDRRLVYFNRYKQSEDMESLAKLVSDENKDFYINFMKYMKAAPIFTIKRDLKGRIIKTPTDEYVFPIVMTLEGKEKKVSLTFIEEKMDQGSKWLIYNSNIHIQALPPKPNTNLGSSVVTPPTTPTTPKTTTTTPPKDNNLGSSAVIGDSKTTPSLPVVKDPKPAAPVEKAPTPSAGLDMVTIIFIATASVVIVGGIGGYYVFSRRRKAKKILAASAMAASATILSEVSPLPETHISAMPTPPSNVTVSSVEEIHSTPTTLVTVAAVPSDITKNSLDIDQAVTSGEKTRSEESIGTEDSTQVSVEKEAIQTPSNEDLSSASSQGAQTVSSPQEVSMDQEKILEIASQPDIFTPAAAELNVPVETSIPSVVGYNESIIKNTDTPNIATTPTPAVDMTPHALFDGVFDTVPGEESTQNVLNLTS